MNSHRELTLTSKANDIKIHQTETHAHPEVQTNQTSLGVSKQICQVKERAKNSLNEEIAHSPGVKQAVGIVLHSREK